MHPFCWIESVDVIVRILSSAVVVKGGVVILTRITKKNYSFRLEDKDILKKIESMLEGQATVAKAQILTNRVGTRKNRPEPVCRKGQLCHRIHSPTCCRKNVTEKREGKPSSRHYRKRKDSETPKEKDGKT